MAALRGTALFSCFIVDAAAMSVEWLINGTSLDNLMLSNVSQEFVIGLRFEYVPKEYNNTRISCIGNGVLSTENSRLRVQGNH